MIKLKNNKNSFKINAGKKNFKYLWKCKRWLKFKKIIKLDR